MSSNNPHFWKTKSLSEMSRDEWESLCDHCGKCCLLKLQDEDADTDTEDSVYYTNVVCHLFDKSNGHCTDYDKRETLVPSCIQLTQDNLADLAWMPPSCAYRRIMEGRGLPKWHHLVSGNKQIIHDMRKSVLGRVVFENEINEEDLEDYIVTWPLK